MTPELRAACATLIARLQRADPQEAAELVSEIMTEAFTGGAEAKPRLVFVLAIDKCVTTNGPAAPVFEREYSVDKCTLDNLLTDVTRGFM